LIKKEIGFCTKKGEKSSIKFTSKELDKFYNREVFTHNHPSSRSFSFADLSLCIYYNIKEMRIIAPNSIRGKGIWIFKLGELNNSWGRNNVLNRLKQDYSRVSREVREKWEDKVDNLEELTEEWNKMVERAESNHHHDIWNKIFNQDYYKEVGVEYYFEKS